MPALARRAATGGLADMVVENAASEPTAAVIAVRSGATWQDRTAAQFRDHVAAVAKGLLAHGIAAGDRVGLLSRTRYEWTLLDYALWMIGACPVPVYPTSSADQVRWILADSGAVACVVETASHAEAVESVRDALPALRTVWTLDAGAVTAIVNAGTDVDAAEVERRRVAVDPDQPATIVYTSGTTGRPKGCVLSHRNFLAEVDNAIELLHHVFRSVSKYPASTVIFVPLAHVLGRMLQVGCVRARVRLGHQSSLDRAELRDAFTSFRPTFIVGVPYVFERIYDTARHIAEQMGRAGAFGRAADVAARWGEAMERRQLGTGRGPGFRLRLAHRAYDLLVYRRIRAELGGRLHYAVCGGSALGRRLALFFAGAGILVYEGYGLTETTAAATVNPPLAPRFGTAGQPLPGTSVGIADDGEILLRGDQVFAAYWNNPDGTGQVLDGGWLRTGDLGELDEGGYLTVTGRKKDILVTSGGKNVVPGPLQERIARHPLVGQCLVMGDGRPFVAALITLDAAAVAEWASLHAPQSTAAPGALAADPQLTADIQRAVDDANAVVSRAESIRAFRVVPDEFTEANGLLTPSLKVRRRAVLDAYAAEIDDIYRSRPRKADAGKEARH